MHFSNFQNKQRVNVLTHPIRAAREFFRKPSHEVAMAAHGSESIFSEAGMPRKGFATSREHEKRIHRAHRFRLSFAGVMATAIILPIVAMALLAPRRAEARSPPFYGSTSVFSYFLMTPVDGMDGRKSDFWVREGGVAYRLPVSAKLAGAKITPVAMGLYGTTRCKGVPPAETDFFKIALSPNVVSGHWTVTPGVRYVGAESKEWSMQVGPPMHPITVMVPAEYYGDWDFGVRVKREQGRKEPGTVRSVRADFTRFRAMQELGKGYDVANMTVGLPNGWEVEGQYSTIGDNVSFGGQKAWVRNRGRYMVVCGGGYEIGAKSLYVDAGGKVGPLMVVAAYQTEEGSKSYHLIASVDPVGAYKLVAGKNNSH